MVLTPEMHELISRYSLGAVATIDADGYPAVSPKGTFVILDDSRLAFGNIRSPKTAANIERQPQVEILFTDVLARRALRVRGRAQVVPTDHELRPVFEERWPDYIDTMLGFVVVEVTAAHIVTSPAYDRGHSADELRATYIETFQSYL
jgi:general stress protein 26